MTVTLTSPPVPEAGFRHPDARISHVWDTLFSWHLTVEVILPKENVFKTDVYEIVVAHATP